MTDQARHGYLIDSTKGEVDPVTFADLTGLQKLVGGYIEAAFQWPNGDVLYVDEDGLLKAPTRFFTIAERDDQPFAGNGVLVGREIDDTDTTAPPVMSLHELRARVGFFAVRGS